MNRPLKHASPEQFVERLYRALLLRDADPDGRRAMLAMLARGANRLDVLDVFLNSEEFRDLHRPLAFAPPGHFYSPHPGRAEIAAHHAHDWGREALPGIDLRYKQQLELLESLACHYAAVPYGRSPTPQTRYGYDNPAYGSGDAVLLFGMIHHLRPRRIIEVGSGHSSCAMLDAVDRLSRPDTTVTFVEPHAALLRSLLRRGDLDRHALLEQGLQRCPLSLFESLEAGDILFVDSSHVSKLASDVNHLVFEVLPVLKPGVFVHLHDIFYPFEYPPQWYDEGRAWNETYLVRAFLSFNERWRVELFSSYMIRRAPKWFEARMPLVLQNPGGQLWLARGP